MNDFEATVDLLVIINRGIELNPADMHGIEHLVRAHRESLNALSE